MHTHSRTLPSAVVLFSCLMLMLTGCQWVTEFDPSAPPASSSSTSEGSEPESIETRIVRVIDGDTIAVEPSDSLPATNDAGDEHVVRLLGIDAPEMNHHKSADPECGAQEATDNLSELLPEGSVVILTYDPVSDRTDRYDRSLAYVINPGLEDINENQVADGYAMPWYPSGEPEPSHIPDYIAAADEAEQNSAGAHGTCDSIGR